MKKGQSFELHRILRNRTWLLVLKNQKECKRQTTIQRTSLKSYNLFRVMCSTPRLLCNIHKTSYIKLQNNKLENKERYWSMIPAILICTLRKQLMSKYLSQKKDTGSYNCTSGRYIPSSTVIVLSIDNTIIEVNNKQATINTCYLHSIDRIVLFTTYLVYVSTCTCLRNVTLFKIPNLTSFWQFFQN